MSSSGLVDVVVDLVQKGVFGALLQTTADFLVFYVLLRGALQKHRVRRQPLVRAEQLSALRWTLVDRSVSLVATLVVSGAALGLLGVLPPMYARIEERGWAYLLGSAVAGYLVFYVGHPALHTRWLFRHVHHIHHRFRDNTPWVRHAFHPAETVYYVLCVVLILYLVPMHPLAVALLSGLIALVNFTNHLGIETFPAWWVRHPEFGWLTTSTHHGLHHEHARDNYALGIDYDRLLGTRHPDYEARFAEAAGTGWLPPLTFALLLVPIALAESLWLLF